MPKFLSDIQVFENITTEKDATIKGDINLTGKVSSGTWNGNTITVPYGGTGLSTITDTAIITGGGTGNVKVPGPKLTASAFTFGAAGSIKSTSTSAITIDSGTTGTVNIGTSNHNKTINIGTGTGNKTIVIGNNADATVVQIKRLKTAGFVKSDANGTLSVDTTNYTTNTGTVTSVGISVPTGLTASGTPITTSGTLTIALATGYSIPTTTNQTNWTSAYTDTNAATDANTASALVKRSASGDIKVGKINELTLTKQTTGFTIAGGTTSKTLTVSNSITLKGTDNKTLDIGGGGTLKSGAFNDAYVHPSGDGNLHVIATGTTNNGKFLMAGSAAGSLSWGTPTNTTYTAGNGLTLSSTTFSLTAPGTLSVSSDNSASGNHTHKITATDLGAVSTLVKTGADGSVTANNKFNFSDKANIFYNATSKTIDFVFA